MGNSRQPAPVSRKGIGGRGRPHTNLRALALLHTPEVIEALLGLAQNENPCVALGAAKLLVHLMNEPESGTKRGKPGAVKAVPQVLKVKITRFKDEGNSDAERV